MWCLLVLASVIAFTQGQEGVNSTNKRTNRTMLGSKRINLVNWRLFRKSKLNYIERVKTIEIHKIDTKYNVHLQKKKENIDI